MMIKLILKNLRLIILSIFLPLMSVDISQIWSDPKENKVEF